MADRADDDLVGVGERVGELVLEDRAPRGRRARLEDGDQPPAAVAPAQRAQRLAHRRRVVREVVDDGDALGDAAQLLAAAHAGEAAQAAADLLGGQAERRRRPRSPRARWRGCARPASPVSKTPKRLAAARDLEQRAPARRAWRWRARSSRPARRDARRRARRSVSTLQRGAPWRPRARPANRRRRRSRPSAGISATNLRERRLDRVERREDVDVVELDRGEDRGLAAGSAGTSSPCRRTRCRTRRPRRRTGRPCRGASRGRSSTGTPPTRKLGSRPASVSTNDASDEVVVLPCVPATTIECMPREEQLLEQRRERGQLEAALLRRLDLDVVLGLRRCRRRPRRAPSRGSAAP